MTREKHWPRKDWPQRAQRSGIGTPTQRAVLVAMAIEGDYYGEVQAPMSRLAELTAFSEREVQRAAAALVKLGALIVIKPGGGRGNPTRFRLMLVRKRVTMTKPFMDPVKDDTQSPFNPDLLTRARKSITNERSEHHSNGKVALP